MPALRPRRQNAGNPRPAARPIRVCPTGTPRRRSAGGNAGRRAAFTLVEMLATVAALVIVLGLMVSLARYVRRQASEAFTKQVLGQLDVLLRRYEDRYRALPAAPAFVPAFVPDVVPGVSQEGRSLPSAAGSAEGSVPNPAPTPAPRSAPNPSANPSPNPSPGPEVAPPLTLTTRQAPRIVLPVVPTLLPAADGALPEDALPDEAVLQQSARLNNRAFVQALRVEARRNSTEFDSLPQSFFLEGTLSDAWGTAIAFMPALHPAVGMAMANRPFFLSAGPDRRFHTLEDNLYSYEEATDEAPPAPLKPVE